MIPDWNNAGVIPPIRPNKPGHDTDRSPYVIELNKVVEKFAFNPERKKIIQGFLNYRHDLHQIGITSGFQWLDGSFLEQVETIEKRPPNDIDVVSFFYLPIGMTQEDLAKSHADLFISSKTKTKYSVDAYPCILGQEMNAYNVKKVSYWYSMWSHRRDGVWKGFIQVDLDPRTDITAQDTLTNLNQSGGSV